MQYTITDKNLWLKITLDEKEKIGLALALEEATEPIPVLEKRFVELMGMSIVSPEQNGDLTDGAIVTDGNYEWWDNNYQVRSFLNILSEDGEYSLMWVRSHDIPLTREERISFLTQLCVTESILELPLIYSINITNLDIVIWVNEETSAYETLFKNLANAGLGYHIYNPEQLGFPIEFIDLGVTTFFSIKEVEGKMTLSDTLDNASDEVLKIQVDNCYPLYKKAIKLLEQYQDDLEQEMLIEEEKE